MLYTVNSLPLSLIDLDEWCIVKVSGVDTRKFLQGQITVDINHVDDNHYKFAAHCDPKGKVWANLILFKRNDDIYYLIRKSSADIQLKELKKYAAFSKVTIDFDDTLQAIGVAGPNIILPTELARQPVADNNYQFGNNISCLHFAEPISRYILIAEPQYLATLTWPSEMLQQPSQQWTLLDMQAGYAIIDAPNTNQYLPQAFNLQELAAIDFQKGCYCGQEMVARAQYRGINKRALFLLTGLSEQLPTIGDSLSLQLGENWRDTGTILAAFKLDDGTLYVQAILNNDSDQSNVFRLKDDPNSRLTIA